MKTKVDTLIIGSGAGGLSAADWCKNKNIDFIVIDGCNELPLNLHNGVHYLHSIPEIPFKTNIKKITLTDAILFKGKMYDRPSLHFALLYSEKTGESQRPSSIMNVGKDDVAYMPETNTLNSLLQDMYEYAGADNFAFGYWLSKIDVIGHRAYFKKEGEEICIQYNKVISTVPLDKIRPLLRHEFIDKLKLECNSIFVVNYTVDNIVPNWMINIYIPDTATKIYRASILNGICSTESTKELSDHDIHSVKDFLNMFHINMDKPTEAYNWKTGKVISISPDYRAVLVDVLREVDIYQIGRFGLWNRKLLVDSTINQAKAVVDYLVDGNWDACKQKLLK